jgi:hypothetical protein
VAASTLRYAAEMRHSRWALLPLVAAGLFACGTFSESEPVDVPEAGVAEGGPDSALDADAPADGAVLDGGDAAVAFRCTPDAGCKGTSCDERCAVADPSGGDLIRIAGKTDAGVELQILTDCHLYKNCLVVFDKDGDGYDCANPQVGRIGRACSGGGGSTCPTGSSLTVGVSSANSCSLEVCTYTCLRE